MLTFCYEFDANFIADNSMKNFNFIFEQEHSDTKAIVFCEYRESVFLINRMLLVNRPLIKPKVFVGMLLFNVIHNNILSNLLYRI